MRCEGKRVRVGGGGSVVGGKCIAKQLVGVVQHNSIVVVMMKASLLCAPHWFDNILSPRRDDQNLFDKKTKKRRHTLEQSCRG